MKRRAFKVWIAVLWVVLQTMGCNFPGISASPTPASPDIPTVIPTLSISTASPTPNPTSTPNTITLWLSPALPRPLVDLMLTFSDVDGRKIAIVGESTSAMIRAEPEAELSLTTWVYAAVAPFPTLENEFIWDTCGADSGLEDPISCYAAQDTLEAWSPIYGSASPDAIQMVSAQDLLQQAWDTRPSRAVIPFDQLEPQWKVLYVEGISPLDPGLDLEAYPLALHFGLSGDPELIRRFAEVYPWPTSNRDVSQLTTVVMTGVTALTRATAWTMDLKGMTYPAELIGDWLREADFTHTSNEVSFAEDCPKPDPNQSVLRFCSSPRHLELLEAVEIDLIELTGNHILDWGVEAFRYTLEQYEQRGWLTFGGGANLEAAYQPVLLEHHGNRLAFLGCNAAGPAYAWATDTSPGATPCDEGWVHSEISRLREAGYIPIFTYQWAESYSRNPLPNQQAAFRKAIDAGAAIVSGSQAHQAQAFEFYGEGFIHYGPGNLFFDQMWSVPTRQEFILRHVFYGGQHISTELLTAYLEDYAQPRPMTPDERDAFLEEIFIASGW